jgi:hypothetical protein
VRFCKLNLSNLQMFNRANIVGILMKAKKHGLVYFDGEIVFAVSNLKTFFTVLAQFLFTFAIRNYNGIEKNYALVFRNIECLRRKPVFFPLDRKVACSRIPGYLWF